MNKLLVNTPQNVQIEYNVAVLGPRILAYFIDLILIICYIIFINWIMREAVFNDQWLEIGVYSLLFLPSFIYHVFFEVIMNGQTPGKWITGIRVVQMDGQAASFYNYFTRWLIGIFEITLTFGFLALITAIINKKGQRIGDIAANTVLINIKPKLGLDQTIFKEIKDEYVIRFPEVSKLTDRDINIVNDNLKIALKSDNYNILEALTRKLEEIMGVKSDGLGFIDFLETVIKDHYHLHKNK